MPWAIEDDYCGPRRRVPSGHVCGVCRGRQCLFVRVASTGTSSEQARVERCVTRVDSGSFVRPAWRRESAGGRANGCAPASGLSRLHIRFMARRTVVQPLARSAVGWLCSMKRQTNLNPRGSRRSVRFVVRCPAVQVTVPRGMSWKPGDWERFKTPKNLYHASISCRIDAAPGLRIVRYFSSSSETVRSTFGPLYVSQSSKKGVF